MTGAKAKMSDKTELKRLQKKNEKLRAQITKILNEYLMSDERDDVLWQINELIDNELTQEEMCNDNS